MKIVQRLKNVIFFTVLFCSALSVSFGQTRKTTSLPAPMKQSAVSAPAPAQEISVTEWSAIVAALEKEDWVQTELLSSVALAKLKTDNDKKQLARLRYFYLYALAGKAASGKMAYTEFEKIADRFVGKEFLMPSRQFLAACKGNVNYICPVKDDEKTLRVTATNKSGSAVHAFEYVRLIEKVDVAKNEGRIAFVGGNLQKAEVNLYKTNLRVMRLVFKDGFVNLIAKE